MWVLRVPIRAGVTFNIGFAQCKIFGGGYVVIDPFPEAASHKRNISSCTRLAVFLCETVAISVIGIKNEKFISSFCLVPKCAIVKIRDKIVHKYHQTGYWTTHTKVFCCLILALWMFPSVTGREGKKRKSLLTQDSHDIFSVPWRRYLVLNGSCCSGTEVETCRLDLNVR